MSRFLPILILVLVALACGDDSTPGDASLSDVPPTDSATDSATDASDAEGPDARLTDAGVDVFDAGNTPDAFVSCLDERAAGERYPAGDLCNFCECNEDGSTTCTERSCVESSNSGCEYEGVMHGYGERFPSTDECNECVCAASGLACTRRTETCAETPDEGAILLDSPDELCGGLDGFSPEAVLATLPHDEIVVPFLYNRDGDLYRETLPDTELTMRIVPVQEGYAVCRIPRPGQEAIDMEVLIEWFTADGAFDETFHAYLRRNAGGFTNVWTIAAGLEPGALNGSHDPACPEFRGYGFSATIDFDRSAFGSAFKICDIDVAVQVGGFTVAP